MDVLYTPRLVCGKTSLDFFCDRTSGTEYCNCNIALRRRQPFLTEYAALNSHKARRKAHSPISLWCLPVPYFPRCSREQHNPTHGATFGLAHLYLAHESPWKGLLYRLDIYCPLTFSRTKNKSSAPYPPTPHLHRRRRLSRKSPEQGGPPHPWTGTRLCRRHQADRQGLPPPAPQRRLPRRAPLQGRRPAKLVRRGRSLVGHPRDGGRSQRCHGAPAWNSSGLVGPCFRRGSCWWWRRGSWW